ncbi:MAG TPA: GNAT family N-acetyltransferase [Rudaea sp.]|nr:GNAT family N-acetyltransferase [Rudaea sp.]
MQHAFAGPCSVGPSRVGFRPIAEADRAFLAELYASTRVEELAPLPWPDAAKSAFLNQQFTAQHTYYHQIYPDADYLLILRNEERIGRVYVHRSPGRISVIDIALLPEHRGQGIGSALFAELIDEARVNSCEIDLHVEPSNPAQRLYLRLGFRFVERRGVYDYLIWTSRSKRL